MSTPADRLEERIRRDGPISFLEFMDTALYGPGGYYASGARIGEPGDFVTSPHVSPTFARAIANRFRDDDARLEGPLDFVEAGSGSGAFLEAFAEHIRAQAPELGERLRLTAIERSAASRQALERRGIAPKPRILEDAEDLSDGSVTGWIFSNELYDALPVARVAGRKGGGIDELRVGRKGEGFAWERAPAPAEYEDYLARFGVVLEEGQVAEIRPSAAALHRRLARALARGRLVAFDYGHRTRALFHPVARRFGTLAVHSRGRRGRDPLESPGDRDLTAHVHWDDLIAAGEAEGLATEGIFRQGRYLAESGVMDLARDEREKWRAFRLIDPEGMGEELSVLVQSKGLRATELDSHGPSGRMPGR
ncbi:MAG: SAM-dependent methyltransferase [Thermoanaerobaculia bacterium]